MGLTHVLTQIMKSPDQALAARSGGNALSGWRQVGSGQSGVSAGAVTGIALGQAKTAARRRGPVECCFGPRQCPNCPRRGG
jgi:hypothetical protein